MTALIALIVVFLIGYALFNASKKRVMQRMKNWGNSAKIIVAELLLADIQHGRLKDGITFGLTGHQDNELLRNVAAASVNHMFGESPSKLHESLDLERVYSDTFHWLETNQSVKELVVQAVRVLSTANKNLKGIVILEKFGPEFPESPSLDNFLALLKRKLGELPETTRVSIQKTFGIP